MKVSVTGISLSELDVDLLLVPLPEDAADRLEQLSGALGQAFARAARDFTGRASETLLIYPEQARAQRIALVGMGPAAAVDAEALRRAMADGAALALARKARTVALLVPHTALDAEAASQAIVEGFVLATYRFTRYKTNGDDKPEVAERLVLHADRDDLVSRRGAERGRIVAEAVNTARDLVNLSPDEKTPALLARAIEKSGKKYGYQVEVWNKAAIEGEKMGGLLAVNRGSQEPPTFTILTHQPENAVNTRPVVLVGKGVVFDTGGLSLKPTKDSMDHMKADMAGAAAVVGAFEALVRLETPLYVMGFIPATDNRPGENAYVPGDVIRMHSGKTVEVLNTDAEGRLILADALSYAASFNPELALDLATLTGAAVVAFGSEVAPVMTNDLEDPRERLDALEAAGQRSGDFVHRMPMHAAYAKLLESSIADLKNIGGRDAGAITAAKFLEHFVSYPWVHVDIAGPAFLNAANGYRPVGGTGFGVRLLVDFLRDYANRRRRR